MERQLSCEGGIVEPQVRGGCCVAGRLYMECMALTQKLSSESLRILYLGVNLRPASHPEETGRGCARRGSSAPNAVSPPGHGHTDRPWPHPLKLRPALQTPSA